MRKNLHSSSGVLCIFLLLTTLSLHADDAPVHEVRRGDTLYSISRRYDVTVDALRELNGLDEEARIFAGQQLKLPSDYQTYTVERGDTLFGLARRHNTTVATIRQLNQLDESDVLRIGQKLRLPEKESSSDDQQRIAVEPSDPPDLQPLGDPQFDGSRLQTGRESSRTGGDYHWPHDGERSTADGKFPGVYISGNPGDPVVSVSSGRVIYSGPHAVFGHVIFVRSSQGYIYVYGGNDQPEVSVGQQVTPGARIGTVGGGQLTRRNTVFFSIWKDDQFVEPENSPRS
ncbi:murein hydrolase activator EnvC family protein [Spirochaeta africana]|uniref:Metalloendopeptidase-like membrane protein n=1 Tax=Spirochaeta africana (strain ATCC 700263 / DSM 8902 / Z-7692) TaxID=889378 RepID=H9UK73_SPIAZ|nr:M23 family metallopeptidase [Spirochaeta africana]AFG37916.1 metalloendopeptidase-like membrane protein [Spirochaeta africana DSM 8902]